MKTVKGWWDSDLSPHLEISTPTRESLGLIVDSGFNGELMLPVLLIRKLGFKPLGAIKNVLADGSVVKMPTYTGEILWFGQKKSVWIQATNSDEGLLGTELFPGCVVELDPDDDRVVFRKKSSRVKRGSAQ